jgi:hypothetical protein
MDNLREFIWVETKARFKHWLFYYDEILYVKTIYENVLQEG